MTESKDMQSLFVKLGQESEGISRSEKAMKFVDFINELPEILFLIKTTNDNVTEMKDDLEGILQVQTEFRGYKEMVEELKKKMDELEVTIKRLEER